MPIASLSSGCLMEILEGIEVEKPVVQILENKLIMSTDNNERYRILVSDGRYLNCFGMLATQLNKYVVRGQLADNTIIRIDRYITSMVSKSEPGRTKQVLIILDLTVLNTGLEVKVKVGNPVNVHTAPKSNRRQPTDAAPIPAPSIPYNSNSSTSFSTLRQILMIILLFTHARLACYYY